MNNSDMKTEFRMNVRIVSLNDKGLPDPKELPAVGDLYLSHSQSDPETYDQWVWAGETLEWQKLGSIQSFDEENAMGEQRVKNVKAYFRQRKNAINEIEQFMLAELC